MTTTRTVGELMTTDIQVAPGETTAQSCAARMRVSKIRHLPVVDSNGDLLGMVTDGDLYEVIRLGDPWRQVSGVARASSRWPTADQDVIMTLAWQLHEGRDASVVIDAHGRPIGIFTDHDALGIALDELAPGLLVQDLMSAGTPHSANIELSCGEALEQIVELGIHHLVVTDGTREVGVVSKRDLVGRMGEPIGRLIGRAQKSTTTHSPVGAALELMRSRRISCLPVWNVAGIVVGILTRTDVMRALTRQLLSADMVDTPPNEPEPSAPEPT